MSDSCTHCSREVGDKVKVQPTRVTPADGKGPEEVWCPPCFVAKRMHEESPRFQAHQTAVIRCAKCGWESVSFGGRPGQMLRCNHCGAFRGRKIRLAELPIEPRDAKRFAEAARAAGAEVAKSSP